MDNKLLFKIKELDCNGYFGYKYKAADIQFLISILKEDHDDEIYIAALSVFTLANDELTEKLLPYYEELTKQAKLLSLPLLSSSDSVKIYVFMLDLLKRAEDADVVEMAIACLAETHYPVVPLIIEELIDDDPDYLNCLKICLKRIGLKRLSQYLMLSPQIPYEATFCELFGVEKINKIKQRK